MRTSKRILIISAYLFVVALISAILTIPVYIFYNLILLPFIFFCGIQFIFHFLYNRYVDLSVILETKRIIENKPYKDYNVDVNCQVCGTLHTINIDLDDPKFRCKRCNRKNNIKTIFSTTVEAAEVDENRLYDALEKISKNNGSPI